MQGKCKRKKYRICTNSKKGGLLAVLVQLLRAGCLIESNVANTRRVFRLVQAKVFDCAWNFVIIVALSVMLFMINSLLWLVEKNSNRALRWLCCWCVKWKRRLDVFQAAFFAIGVSGLIEFNVLTLVCLFRNFPKKYQILRYESHLRTV